jgi:23S rRNA pseudouridine2605 synthase
LNGTQRRNAEFPVDLKRDRIIVDGQEVRPKKKIYLALNKPRGLVTTASDEKGRETIYSCLPKDLSWVGPVGRLDQASEGLLLLTNDSEWAARITAPESHVDKTYHVRINGKVDDDLLQKLTKGVSSDGELLRAKAARLVRGGGERSWVEVVLDEGKNRQIRRMFEVFGIEVLRLVRIAVGPLSMGNLPKGQWRQLTNDEKVQIDAVIGNAQSHRT